MVPRKSRKQRQHTLGEHQRHWSSDMWWNRTQWLFQAAENNIKNSLHFLGGENQYQITKGEIWSRTIAMWLQNSLPTDDPWLVQSECRRKGV